MDVTARRRELAELGSATLGESGGAPMAARIGPVWSGATVCAVAFPVRCTPGDNLGIHAAVVRAPEESVLVVDVGQLRERGYWGEVLTTAAEARGLAGLVIDGCVRDVAALESHGFPVFSSGIALRGATKLLPGTTGLPARIGEVVVEAGDWVVGDRDGVVVIPANSVDDVLEAGRQRADKESKMFEALRGGASTVELLGLDLTPVVEQ